MTQGVMVRAVAWATAAGAVGAIAMVYAYAAVPLVAGLRAWMRLWGF